MLEWYFRGFADELSPLLRHISPLPEKPSYYMTQYGVNYNPEWPIRVNVDHILGDEENLSRIPADIREAQNLPLILETAVELARRKAVVEPSIVVSQGYQGRVQYLLPICLTDMERPDLAMTLTIMDGYYLGNLIIEPAEAEVVKRIYREYLEGASLLQIGRGLEADGILTGAGKTKWRPETLKKILQNEKYIGDALLQKTYTVDFLNKKRVQNKGIVPQYYVENSHEPIIPRDLYMQVQEEMIRRANLHSGANRKKRVYSSKYALSSIVYCSKCGEIYRRIAWNNRGKHSTVWRCCTRVEHGPTACDAPTIQEQDLQAAVVQAFNHTLGNRENMMATLQENIEVVIRQEDETSSEGIEAKLLELQKELLKLANSKKDYNSVADEIDRLRELKQNALVESAEREGQKQRIREMREFLERQSTEITEYDELLVRRLIEKVTVYDERFEVEFKSGAKVDVERWE